MEALEVKHVSVSISCNAKDVYAFVSDPKNLPKWASGLSGSIREVNGEWLADSPMGLVKIQFAPANEFGVMDHDVTLKSGVTFHNPMRVLPNREGSEVVFTLFRQPEMTDEKFLGDADWVKKDLQKLKTLLER